MIWWGVRREPGVVYRVYDGPRAFREERILREEGWGAAQACVSADRGETWRLVPWESTVRADPVPPAGARQLRWGEALLERWCNRQPFRRRRLKGAWWR